MVKQLEGVIDRVANLAFGRGRDAVACIESGVDGGFESGQRHRISLASGIETKRFGKAFVGIRTQGVKAGRLAARMSKAMCGMGY
jgi:hypothetical protein